MSTQIPNVSPEVESLDAPLFAPQDNDVLATIRSQQAKIAVLGMGHVGLPTALGLADLGWQVLGADSSKPLLDQLRAGQPPFYEPGIEKLLRQHLGKKFHPTANLEQTIREATILFVCVGTPQRENGEADLSQVEAVARTIAQNLNGYKLIVEKSTVPAVTAQWVKRTILRYAKNAPRSDSSPTADVPESATEPMPDRCDFDVASNPEFLQEGAAVRNVFRPHRIVCGVESERARLILEELYRPLHSTVLVTGLSTAELIKHAANSFLAMKISFINMVADLCELVGADVTQVACGVGMDPRIGPQFLNAGIGFGGYCFPKDLRAFIHLAEQYGLDFSLLKEVENINRRRIDVFLKKVRQALWVLQAKTVAVLGLAFKPSTDDIREAPGLKIVNALLSEGARLRLHDPQAMPATKAVLPENGDTVVYCEDAYTAAEHAHLLIVLTEWPEYSSLDLRRLRDAMDVPVVIDGRNVFDPAAITKLGFEYQCIGR